MVSNMRLRKDEIYHPYLITENEQSMFKGRIVEALKLASTDPMHKLMTSLIDYAE